MDCLACDKISHPNDQAGSQPLMCEFGQVIGSVWEGRGKSCGQAGGLSTHVGRGLDGRLWA